MTRPREAREVAEAAERSLLVHPDRALDLIGEVLAAAVAEDGIDPARVHPIHGTNTETVIGWRVTFPLGLEGEHGPDDFGSITVTRVDDDPVRVLLSGSHDSASSAAAPIGPMRFSIRLREVPTCLVSMWEMLARSAANSVD